MYSSIVPYKTLPAWLIDHYIVIHYILYSITDSITRVIQFNLAYQLEVADLYLMLASNYTYLLQQIGVV